MINKISFGSVNVYPDKMELIDDGKAGVKFIEIEKEDDHSTEVKELCDTDWSMHSPWGKLTGFVSNVLLTSYESSEIAQSCYTALQTLEATPGKEGDHNKLVITQKNLI